jgi:hypothetical protein
VASDPGGCTSRRLYEQKASLKFQSAWCQVGSIGAGEEQGAGGGLAQQPPDRVLSVFGPGVLRGEVLERVLAAHSSSTLSFATPMRSSPNRFRRSTRAAALPTPC